MPNVVLATTCWSEVKEHARAERRENELCKTHWKEMLDNGTRCMRFEKTYESAWTIADRILEKGPCAALDLQVQVVDESKPIQETTAGGVLKKSSPNILVALTKKIRRLFAR